jgi:hypothetical protein
MERMHWVTARNTFPEGEWSTPTLTEIPWDTLPIELRMLALGPEELAL